MKQQIRVYVEDETYKKLSEIAEKTGRTPGQVAGDILDEKTTLEELLKNTADILRTIVENQQQITSLLDEHHKTLFEAFKYLYWTLAKTGIMVREYTNIKVNTDEVKKAVNQAVSGVKEKVKEGE